jgi:hypothetical protein
MPRKRATKPVPQTSQLPVAAPTIYEATLLSAGGVKKGNVVTQTYAESLRKKGLDVVVCGPHHGANMSVARDIERNANGSFKRCPPHPKAGPNSLPHYQPDPRGPAGHTFYETANRHAL